jgi:hypothetical protein
MSTRNMIHINRCDLRSITYYERKEKHFYVSGTTFTSCYISKMSSYFVHIVQNGYVFSENISHFISA